MSTIQNHDLQLYRRIVEQAPDAIIFADREGVIRLWNAGAEAIFGYMAGEAVAQNLDLIIPEKLRAAHWRGYELAMTTGRTKLNGKALATRGTHKLGTPLYVEMAFKVITDEQGGVLGALATARDITQRYLAERARKSA